jgi:hypothetical protein
MHGAVSKTRSYRLLYAVMAPVLPLFQRIFPTAILTTESVGRAMINVAARGYTKQILEAADIYKVA